MWATDLKSLIHSFNNSLGTHSVLGIVLCPKHALENKIVTVYALMRLRIDKKQISNWIKNKNKQKKSNFFLVMKTSKIYSLCNLRIYNAIINILYSGINYSHHAIHDITRTSCFYNWKLVPFVTKNL